MLPLGMDRPLGCQARGSTVNWFSHGRVARRASQELLLETAAALRHNWSLRCDPPTADGGACILTCSAEEFSQMSHNGGKSQQAGFLVTGNGAAPMASTVEQTVVR